MSSRMVEIDDQASGDQAHAEVAQLLEQERLQEPAPADPASYDVFVERRLAVLARIEAEIARNDEAADRHIQLVRDRRDENNAVLERQRAWLVGQLLDVARSFPYPRGKKTRRLAFGEIGLRATPPTLVIDDYEQALRFAKETPELAGDVQVIEFIGVAPLKAWAKSNGYPPAGCTYHPGGSDEPFVRVKGDDEG